MQTFSIYRHFFFYTVKLWYTVIKCVFLLLLLLLSFCIYFMFTATKKKINFDFSFVSSYFEINAFMFVVIKSVEVKYFFVFLWLFVRSFWVQWTKISTGYFPAFELCGMWFIHLLVKYIETKYMLVGFFTVNTNTKNS